MPTNYEEVKKPFDIPLGSTQDDIADMLRAILSTKAAVKKVVFEVTPGRDRQGVMTVDMMVPRMGPPDGEILEPDPENLWQLISKVPFENVELRKVKMRVPAVMRSVALLGEASRGDHEAKIPVAWMINENPDMFLKWLGVRLENSPSIFMGLPLLKVPFVEEDRLVLLCARSRKMDPLHSERGLVLIMET